MFYHVRAFKVTFREFWWETKLLFWVVVLIKLFRMTPRASTDDLAVESLKPFEADPAAIPGDTMQLLEPIVSELQSCGFNGPVLWHDQTDVFQATRNTLATMVHTSGQAFARIQCRANAGRVPPKLKVFATIITPGGDNSYIVSTNGKPDMAWPKSHNLQRDQKKSATELWAQHQSRLSSHRELVPRISGSELADAAEAYHISLRDFHLSRGVFIEMPLSEQALYAASPAPTNEASPALADKQGSIPPPLPGAVTPAAPDLMETAAIAELTRMQRKTSSWGATTAILAISLVLFILSMRNGGSDGDEQWMSDGKFLLTLIPILFIHEFGHYIAMRGFGYRNLKMFFIPFFGAAVSGQHYNVPGWKKIIVSLMGPLPGIALGVIAGILGLILNRDWLVMAGLLSLIINAFNLIPILPFDGGWVAHAVLFSRSLLLDIGFRIVAAVGLLGMSIFLPGARFLMYAAIAMLISLPSALIIARVVSELRKEGFASSSLDGNTIPQESAKLILARLRSLKKKGLQAKLAAQYTLRIFETLNARPPGALASVGFLTLHFGSIVLAVVSILGIIGFRALKAGDSAGYGDAFQNRSPKYAIEVAAIASQTTGELPAEYFTVVLNMKDRQDATTLSRSIANEATAARPRRIVTLGHVVMVSVPVSEATEREALLSRARPDTDAFVETDRYRALLSLECRAPEAADAAQISDEFAAYLQANELIRAAPPWASEADWPAERRETDRAARKQFIKLQQGRFTNRHAAEWKRVTEESIAARRKGDTAAVERLSAQSEQLTALEQREFRESMLAEQPGSKLAQTYFDIEEDQVFERRRRRLVAEIGPMLGPWPAGRPVQTLVSRGYASATGDKLSFAFVQFERCDTGIPTLFKWLSQQGCTDFKFNITGTEWSGSTKPVDSDEP